MLISIADQSLRLVGPDGTDRIYRVSTAANGAGCRSGSFCTPIGRHRVRLKIGDGCPVGTVFRRRRATGEIYDGELGRRFPGRDWVLTRILWLDGLEQGVNRGGEVDTLRRFIYLHGTPYEQDIGQPVSHGCIRVGAADLVEIFDAVTVGAEVLISP
ncbi:L,D-transpeptidase [Ramlibacter tataouinensis]|uniref:L,D-TPase catalytic domain-containing protein n=1 Tax=Ramlibacter tataouinensis (strain ATCC BAA-407 / DSM 14655 / LMG 21543 / TTB310) TaxID=365046 RepID=F5Y3X1_RAMTT|nr:L,D-transpeptidase [Ramlibacter tataouinensis]AEG91249.1 Conserved hypothetical protein [Ramlibacter tataouinensis TTB310]